jgi:ankyrin repeat protein
MIKYIMSRGVLLTSTTKFGDSPLSFIGDNESLSENDKSDLRSYITDVMRSLDRSYDEIDMLLASDEYDKLLSFRSFDLKRLIDNGSFLKLFRACDDSIIEHILRNSIDINCESDQHIRPIHIISKYGSPYIVNYVLQRTVDVEAPSTGGWRPIHYAVKYQSLPVIMLMINRCNDFRSILDDGSSIVNMIRENNQLTSDNKNIIAIKILEKMRSA